MIVPPPKKGDLPPLQQLARHYFAVSPVAKCLLVYCWEGYTRKAVDIQIYVKNKQVSGQVDRALIRYSRIGKSLKK